MFLVSAKKETENDSFLFSFILFNIQYSIFSFILIVFRCIQHQFQEEAVENIQDFGDYFITSKNCKIAANESNKYWQFPTFSPVFFFFRLLLYFFVWLSLQLPLVTNNSEGLGIKGEFRLLCFFFFTTSFSFDFLNFSFSSTIIVLF